MWRIPVQNHLKPSITEKRRNKVKYLTWNSIILKFVKKTSMPNPVISLGYIKCYDLSSPRPSSSNSIRHNCEKICSWSRRPKTILEIRKKGHISLDDQQSYYLQVFKDFTNNRKKTNRAVVFSCRPFPNILKYKDHQWRLQTIWKTRFLQKHIEEFSYYVSKFRLTIF